MSRSDNARAACRAALAAALAAVVALGAGCSGSEAGREQAQAEADAGERGTGSTDGSVPSEAARSRGLAVRDEADEVEEVKPEIVLQTVVYEWKESPERGLRVVFEFVNPNVTYERARGYAFAVASSTSGGRPGAYPWDAELVNGEPEDYRDGTRLLYRDDQTVSAFIPYSGGVGYYDRLKVLVYDEDGDLLIGESYELELDGSPSGPKETKPALVL
ncbi:MAG: hypothetical protein GF405_09250 [Candidatus Eisenbacteria bacterium]|nr:hypothetical protein [Candidatus Eisenbacteria bacterium]